jgi:hypothetical protein
VPELADMIRTWQLLTNDRERERAARHISATFKKSGGCGWCWSEDHAHGTCDISAVYAHNGHAT